MGGQKYMLIKYNPENNSAYLSREGGGGACIVRTKTTVVIGIWKKSAVMGNNTQQNPGNCNELVEKMARFLTYSENRQ